MNELDRFDSKLRRVSVVLYTVAVGAVLVLANAGSAIPIDRLSANVLVAVGLVSCALVWVFPWHRYPRDLFLVMTLSAVVLAALGVYISGGVNSPFDSFFFLAAIFVAIFFSRTIAILAGLFIAAGSLLPLLYSQSLHTVDVVRLLVSAVVYLAAVLVGNLMTMEMVRRETLHKTLRADLKEVRELRDAVQQSHQLEQRRANGLLALQRSGAAVYGHSDVRSALRTILAELVDSLGYEFVSIYQVEDGNLVLTGQRGYEPVTDRVPLGRGVMSRVVISGKSVLIPDVSREPDFVSDVPGVVSQICVPLRMLGQVVGVINVETRHSLDNTDLELMELCAQHVSAAMANANLLTTRAHRERRALAASRLLTRLNRQLLLEEVIEAATQGPRHDYDLAGAAMFVATRSDGGGEWRLHVSSSCRLDEDALRRAMQRLCDKREAVLLPDSRVSVDDPDWRWVRGSGIVSAAAYPLIRGDDVLGVFAIASREYLDADDFDLFGNFATQVALSLENARLYARERRRTVQLETVHTVGREVVSILEPEVLYNEAVRALHERFGYRVVTVFVPGPQEEELTLVSQVGLRSLGVDGPANGVSLNLGRGIVGHVAATGEPYISGDVSKDPFYVSLGHNYIQSEIAVPVRTARRLLGVLDVESEEPYAFDDTDVMALEAVADYLAIALQNATAHRLLARQATTDPLTGLLNHRALIERLDEEIERARRFNHPLTVIFFDIDHFKVVNDTHGHQAGDVVLGRLGHLASRLIRAIDTVGRYGGEEFVAILPETDLQQGLNVADRLCRTIADHAFTLDDGTVIHITISLGVASYPTYAQSRHDLLSYADRALYQAKRKGRNAVASVDMVEPGGGTGESAVPRPFIRS